MGAGTASILKPEPFLIFIAIKLHLAEKNLEKFQIYVFDNDPDVKKFKSKQDIILKICNLKYLAGSVTEVVRQALAWSKDLRVELLQILHHSQN